MSTKVIKISEYGTVTEGFDKFCAAPWNTVWYGSEGNVKVCCASTEVLGNVKQQSMEEIINGPLAKKLRQEFLLDKCPTSCEGCWESERAGPDYGNARHVSNGQGRLVIQDSLENCLPDGTLIKQNLKFVDLIWTNKCNFSCLHCKASISSNIADKYADVFSIWNGNYENPKHYTTEQANLIDNSDKMKYILDHADQIDEIHFNGGEPFMQEETYELLSALLDRKLNEKINIWFHTNGSIRTYKDVDIVSKYLKPWGQKCKITMSHDHFGERGRYFRYGYSEKKWLENFNRFYEEGMSLTVQVSLTLFNMPTLSKLKDWYKEHDIIGRTRWKFNYTTEPMVWNLNNLSYDDSLKKQTLEEIENCKDLDPNCLSNCAELLNQPFDYSDLKTKFVPAINALDKKRNTNFFETFPELVPLYNRLS